MGMLSCLSAVWYSLRQQYYFELCHSHRQQEANQFHFLLSYLFDIDFLQMLPHRHQETYQSQDRIQKLGCTAINLHIHWKGKQGSLRAIDEHLALNDNHPPLQLRNCHYRRNSKVKMWNHHQTLLGCHPRLNQ